MNSLLKGIDKLINSCDCNYECNAKWFKQNFKNWTSGNKQIAKFTFTNIFGTIKSTVGYPF
jgi:hypothetical protein